jgi:excisionase family DNA binding protein
VTLPRLYTPAEAAEALRVGENYVLTQCRAGRWPHVRVARGAIRLTADDVARVVELCRAEAASATRPDSQQAPLAARRPRRIA